MVPTCVTTTGSERRAMVESSRRNEVIGVPRRNQRGGRSYRHARPCATARSTIDRKTPRGPPISGEPPGVPTRPRGRGSERTLLDLDEVAHSEDLAVLQLAGNHDLDGLPGVVGQTQLAVQRHAAEAQAHV